VTKPPSFTIEDASAPNAILTIQIETPNTAPSLAILAPQDRWSRDKNIKLVNIVDFLFEEEPKMVSEALKHPGWVDAMQEELNQFARNKVWILIKQSESGISINQENYVNDMLKKYDINGSLVKTPMVPPYQANPKEAHLIAIRRIFRKSTSGACRLLGGKLVCWSAKKHQFLAMYSAEAEYVAATRCCANILWMKSQLNDYDIVYEKVPIFCDNTSGISNNLVLHSRTKHIEIRYHFIIDHIIKGDIELHFIPTQYQLVDIFTKPLDEPTFKRLIVELGMLNIDGTKPEPLNEN
ncbi:hypothetical protein Tco_0632483, partial [Tanacetum coccineum]